MVLLPVKEVEISKTMEKIMYKLISANPTSKNLYFAV